MRRVVQQGQTPRHLPTLAGEGNEEIMSAVGAAGTGAAVGEDAAVEVAAEL